MLSCRYLMPQKSILSKPKWGAQAFVRGHGPPGPPRSDGTGCAAVIFATIRCLRYFKEDFKSLKITSPSTVIVPQPLFFALLRSYCKRRRRNRNEFDWCAADKQL